METSGDSRNLLNSAIASNGPACPLPHRVRRVSYFTRSQETRLRPRFLIIQSVMNQPIVANIQNQRLSHRLHPACNPFRWFTAALLAFSFIHSPQLFANNEPDVGPKNRPNVVIVLTDDQGYGDLGCHGNPVIKTSNIDKLFSESSSLSDYHVAPTCSPTRSALLTGHWTNRTGVWHTINGRSMLRANEVTVGQLFKDAGYQTGMFGKWHLGDNYPYRPEDRGFTKVYRHGGGGVGQTPDVWDNAYFDGSYFHDGKIEAAKGFCTDVFFNEANQFIESCVEKNDPFLAYISLNAPHGPLHCPEKIFGHVQGSKGEHRSFLRNDLEH